MSSNKKTWSRREFMKTAGVAGMAALAASKELRAAALAKNDKGLAPMPTRPFGKTGVSVPMLGLGGSQNLESKQRLLRQAVKLGVTYWDTAESYSRGGSEAAMGRHFEKYPGDRKRIFLVTKSHETQPSRISESLDASLKRLKTDYIDLFFVHGISDPGEMTEDIRGWAESKKAEGKIRFIGFSSHSNMEACMKGAADLGWIDGIMVTYNYRLMHTKDMQQAIDACVKAGIGLTAMKTQATSWWVRQGKKNQTAEHLIERISKKGFTLEQAKLKAVWENPHIGSICSEMSNLKMLSSNVTAALSQTKLSLGEIELMKRFAQESAHHYCAGCARICESVLETRIPISDTMRYLMYARCYKEPKRAGDLFQSIPSITRGQMAHSDFVAAETVCPQGMPIAKLMKEALIELS